MKIYPSLHSLQETDYDKVNAADIPLACINIDNSDFEYYITKEKDFTDNIENEISPYDEFDSNAVYLFDNDNQITNIELKNDKASGKYLYIPQSSKEFVPLSFSYQVLIKKAMSYASDKIYDLAIAGSGSQTFLQGLMPLFGDAPIRGVCPANISVNGQDQQLSSIWKSSYKNQDFLFVETTDGINYTDNGSTGKLDVSSMLDKNTNVWLCVDTFDKTLLSKTVDTFNYKKNILYNDQSYQILKYNQYFNTTIENSNYPMSSYTYINLFDGDCPILLLESANNGFVVVAPKSFMTVGNSKLIYEIMMQIVLNGYYKTEEQLTWITDAPVDYLLNTQIFNRKHPNINLNDLLTNNRYDIGSAFKIIKVTTSNDGVILDQINYNNDMFFKKVDIQPDPVKEDGAISIYTTKHSVLIYNKVVIKRIETSIDVEIKINDNGHYIIIGPCKSSAHEINISESKTLQIANYNRAFYITFNTAFMLVDYAQYDASIHGTKIAYIQPIHKIDAVKYDTRIEGGGLPEDKNDDYNLADISCRKGRPIRRGLSTVIRLPLKYKQYEERIRKEISRHAASGEFVAIIFEDR